MILYPSKLCPSCGETGFIRNLIFYHKFVLDADCTMEGKEYREDISKLPISIPDIPPLKDYQINAINHNLSGKTPDLIVVPTGEGKTIIGLSIINHFKYPSIMVCPTIILTKQWVNVIRSFGGKSTSISSEGDNVISPLTITTYASLLKNLDMIDQFKIIIFDESHHVCSQEYQKIADYAMEKGLRVIGLTATERWDEIGRQIQERIFQRKYVRTISDRQNSENRVDLRFIEEKITLTPEQYNSYYDNWKLYTEKLREYGGFLNMMRYGGSGGQFGNYNEGVVAYNRVKKLLSEHPFKLDKAVEIIQNNPGTFIVFGDTIKMAKTIHEKLLYKGIKAVKIHTTNKKNKNDRKDQTRSKRENYIQQIRDGEVRVLVGVHAIEEGLDLPDMDNAIFVSIFSPSVLKATQRSGRVMRSRPGKLATIYVIYAEETIEETKRLPELRKLLAVK